MLQNFAIAAVTVGLLQREIIPPAKPVRVLDHLRKAGTGRRYRGRLALGYAVLGHYLIQHATVAIPDEGRRLFLKCVRHTTSIR